MAIHHRWTHHHPDCNLWPPPLPGYSIHDVGILSHLGRTCTRHLPRPRNSRAPTMEPRFRKESLQQLVLVRLRDAMDHCWRDRVILLQLSAGALHEVHDTVFRRSAQQLSNWCPSRGYRINSLLGHSDRFPRGQAISGWVLDWDHGYRNISHDPESPREHSECLWSVLLGGHSIRLSGYILCMGQRCDEVGGG